MGIKEKIISDIVRDLNIKKFKFEPESFFINRSIYAALIEWFLCILDDNEQFEDDLIGISKTYITRRLNQVIDEYRNIYSDFDYYLAIQEKKDFSVFIREIFEQAGYIRPCGFSEYITKSPPKLGCINEKLLLVRNEFNRKDTESIGFGKYRYKTEIGEVVPVKSMFYINELSASEWTKEYIKILDWKKCINLGSDVKYFDINSQNNFSSSWKEIFPKNCSITLYKNNDFDYGFVRFVGNKIVGLPIEDYLIGVSANEKKYLNNDVRRFMYGLRALHSNKVIVKIYKQEDCLRINLSCLLPGKEEVLLHFLGWPYKQVRENNTIFIVPLKLYDTAVEILKNLSVEIEESYSESIWY